MTEKKRILIAGAGGHARVVLRLLALRGEYSVAGAVDPDPRADLGVEILGGDDALPDLAGSIPFAAVGLGCVKDTAPRRRLRETLENLGFRLPALIHPDASVDETAVLGDGVQVMAGTVVNPFARIGKGVVVNTGAVVEHDVEIGDDAFVGPGACVGGAARIGAEAFVGLGASVLQGVRIGAKAVVGAGAVVISDVEAGALVVGVPAKPVA